MTIQKDDREYSASYAEDLLSAEKNLFLLRCIRNSIQKKYDESTDTALSSNEQPEEKPKPVECKLKRVPEKPSQNNSKSKMIFFSNILMQFSVICCVLLFVDFIAVLIATGFFSKALAESGVFGELLTVFMVFTVSGVIGSVILRIIESVRYKEEMKSWLAIKEQIEKYNLEEIKKSEELNRQQNEQFYKNAQLRKVERMVDVFMAQVKAEVYELEKAKINTCIMTAENQTDKLYSVSKIPHSLRRVDVAFMLNSYFADGSAKTVSDAVKLYNSALENGSAAPRLSDILDDKEKYASIMPDFIEYIDFAGSEAAKATENAQVIANDVAAKAVNKETGAINQGKVANEFRRTYAESKFSALMDEIIEKNRALTDKYNV